MSSLRFGALLVISLSLVAARASAQRATRRYADAPSDGLALPTAPRAGDADARAVTMNPAGTALLDGGEVALVMELEDPTHTTGNATAVGFYAATPIGGDLLPRLGLGLGLEWLRPERTQLEPDPGSPLRLTIADALRLGRRWSFGTSWHYLYDGGPKDGFHTWDLALSGRLGDRVAVAALVRDLLAPTVAGVQVPRRYELETTIRPGGTSRLELGLGGRIDEDEGELDGWGRAQLRVARGVYLHAQVESRHLAFLDTLPDGAATGEGRELRGTVGLELSFGRVGVTTAGTGVRDERGRHEALGGAVTLRLSSVGLPPVQGTPLRIDTLKIGGTLSTIDVLRLTQRILEDQRDPQLQAIVVVFDAPDVGWASMEELRTAILAARGAGKKVFAYLGAASTKDYYVASAADKVYLDPAGQLDLRGIATTSTYFRGTFDAVGIVPEFTKIAEYKSAPEQFTETGATAPAARMRTEVMDGIWTELIDAIAASRHLARAAVLELIDAGGFTPEALAHDARLVDAVADPDHVDSLIASELGGELGSIGPPPHWRASRWTRPAIAVIAIEGEIVDGESQPASLVGAGSVGGATIAAAIAAARDDDRIRAIVLRIDSPGGSASASEVIAREVFHTRGAKPILCSFGDLAASGGYFAAAGCDQIFAPRTSITGSIGIFAGTFDLSGLAARLGVTVQTEARGRFADLASQYRAYTEDDRRVVRERLRYLYGRFVGAVADGRHLDRAKVDEVGRGHVWTGAQAQRHGLVDKLGTFNDALDEARRLAGIPADRDVELVVVPRPRWSLGRLVTGILLGRSHADAATALDVRSALGTLVGGFVPALFDRPGLPLARLPFTVTW